MKQILTATAVAGLIVSLAPVQMANAAAHNPLIVWQGGATITSLSAACSTVGFAVGDLVHSVYRPILDPAEPKTAISFVSSRGAVIFFQASGNAFMASGAGTYSGNYVGGRATMSSTAVTGNWTMTVTPSTFTAATVTPVTITGSITNFYKTAGCTVGFKGAYQRRP